MPDLSIYNQEQILRYYDELSDSKKEILNEQINKIDFNFMNQLYKNSYYDEELDINKISPLKIIDSNKAEDNSKIGEEIVKNGEYAVLLMAGGFGSRLGLEIPKGCLTLKIKDKKISLFEIFINQLKQANEKNNTLIKLYIMTGKNNNEDTIKFFKDNNYFNYGKDNIKIFVQDELPILNTKGKILLKSKNEILFGPNGNGDVFASLKRNNLIDDMKNNHIKYVLFSSIDNALNNIVDYNFIGNTLKNNYELSSKTLSKENEDERDWIFCKYDNKPFMLPTRYITKDITNYKVNNEYVYREKNITYHLISINYIEKFANEKLKYHRAYKKNNHLDEDGTIIIPDSPNSFKFEKFIFDAFEYADDMLLYRVDRSEFCPIKVMEDIKKVEDYLNK